MCIYKSENICFQKDDPQRIVSIYTDYLTRGDNELEQQDKLFAVRVSGGTCGTTDKDN